MQQVNHRRRKFSSTIVRTVLCYRHTLSSVNYTFRLKLRHNVDFAIRLSQMRHCWIGLRRYSESCTCVQASVYECEVCRASWSWSDGSAMSWWNWQPQEPGVTACGRLGADDWTEYGCSASNRFICERGKLHLIFF